MSYAIRLPDQLKQHLRALRKSRGLTQAQLGALVGVKQARMAEIEADPGAVSLDQLMKVLAALGGTLHLHMADAEVVADALVAAAAPRGQAKASATQRKVTVAAEPAPPTYVVVRPNKGVW